MTPRPLISAAVISLAAAASAVPKFEERTIDPQAGDVVYAVTHADVDGDGKEDVVAVTENAVYWYAAPDWKKHTVIRDQTIRDNVCIAPHDVDGDGKVDFALGAGWPNNGGTIQWLSRNASLDERWDVHFVAKIPWAHRMSWADVLGTGKPQLVVSPLNKSGDDPGVRLTAFEIPAHPTTDRWPATVVEAVIGEPLNGLHNHWHVDGGSPVFTFTASREGVHAVFQVPNPTRAYGQFKISGGAAGKTPADQGAGEVKVGELRNGRRLLATIEPMHGNAVVVYLGQIAEDPVPGMTFNRVVVDGTLSRGHALSLADLDADGDEELIAGHSEPAKGSIKGPGIYVYEAEGDAGTKWTKWTKYIVDDGGMATEDLFALDMTGDERIDIVAGGRDTHNVKLYVNMGEK